MIRNSKRSIRLLSWRTLRWAIAVPSLPLVWWACTSHPLAQPTPAPEQQTDIYITVAPNRLLDLVFMVDNSPSMAPKVTKMNAQFPNLIAALKDPNDGTLPDLRVAIIDSDLGTGGAYTTGSCGPKNGSSFGDLGKFQMIGATACGVTSPNATYLEYLHGQPVNYTGDINTVFACLAGNLGTLGCGEEHQLQAFEFALVAGGLGNDAQHDMLRPAAYLGLVFLTDEDDCSAAMNDGMFGDKPELRTESASLRCYTRSHACGGGVRNLSDAPPGYPTSAAFSTTVSDCSARTDACPNTTDGPTGTDTSVPTTCSPLKGYKQLAAEIKYLKSDPEQILVAGIFGWPIDGDTTKAPYKIDLIPNPNTADTAHPTVYDSWPTCYDPNHMPAAATTDKTTNFDSTAAGWGATAGLRNAAFIDEFGANGLKFSICQPDFSASMKLIGDTIAKKLQNLCVDYKLIDTNPTADGVQADCRVVYRHPKEDPADKTKIIFIEDPTSMLQCDPSKDDNSQPAYPCWKLVNDKTKCKVNGQLINIVRAPAERNTPLDPGTKVSMQCRTCTGFQSVNPATGNLEELPGCNYPL
jgi:hypothetical protein